MSELKGKEADKFGERMLETEREMICKCGHHKNFHINEFVDDGACAYGMRIGEKGVIKEGCNCKKFVESQKSEEDGE